jgi:hypothetical protein
MARVTSATFVVQILTPSHWDDTREGKFMKALEAADFAAIIKQNLASLAKHDPRFAGATIEVVQR